MDLSKGSEVNSGCSKLACTPADVSSGFNIASKVLMMVAFPAVCTGYYLIDTSYCDGLLSNSSIISPVNLIGLGTIALGAGVVLCFAELVIKKCCIKSEAFEIIVNPQNPQNENTFIVTVGDHVEQSPQFTKNPNYETPQPKPVPHPSIFPHPQQLQKQFYQDLDHSDSEIEVDVVKLPENLHDIEETSSASSRDEEQTELIKTSKKKKKIIIENVQLIKQRVKHKKDKSSKSNQT